MKLVKQTILVFLEGRTEKVYEVDLCEVGPAQFVVNFRYGKRGVALKDGSKTPMPVNRAEADKAFDKLVATKVEQGYAPEGTPRPAPRAPAAAPAAAAASSASTGGRSNGSAAAARADAGDRARADRVVARLREGAGGRFAQYTRSGKHTWKLDRAIWRAGELRIREAEPLLLPLIGTASGNDPAQGGKGMRDYCIAWALGRCGSAASVSALGALYGDRRAPGHVRRIATEALLMLSDEATRAEFRADAIGQLPAALQAPAREGSPAAFTEALARYLRENHSAAGFEVLDTVYLIDSPTVRPALLAALDAPLKSPLFQRIRHIFKIAEYRADAEVFGRIAYRFERSGPESGREGYGAATRFYVRGRVWRTLRRNGEDADAAFVKMAVGVLLPFKDADIAGSGQSSPFWAFNYLLYRRSGRFIPDAHKRTWRPADRRRTPPSVSSREDAFPNLWNENPAGLMHLCAESECLPVHELAAKALADNPGFCAELDFDDLAMLASRPYEPTAKLAFDLAQPRFDARAPHAGLLSALASSVWGPARERAFQWIDAARPILEADTTFIASLVLARHADARAFARRFLRATVLPHDRALALLGRLLSGILALGEGDEAIAKDALSTITTALNSVLATVPVGVIRDLLKHPLASAQELAGEFLLRFDARSGLIPEDVVLGLLHSAHPSVRAVGLRLVAELSDEVLVAADQLLTRLCCDKNADVRSAGRALIARIAKTQPEGAEFLAQQLVEALLRRKLADGVPGFLVELLRGELAPSLADLPKEVVLRLLDSGSPHAQELGGVLLPSRVSAAELSLDEIVRLASHEILSVREAAWAMCESSVDRIRGELAEAVRILDAKWADSREWAKKFFRDKFVPADYSIDVVTTIIDSVRDEVQAFGREMAQRSFREEDGPQLLVRTSEHPARAVQLFATNFLERYAAGDVARIEALAPYFTRVLTNVNAGRVAKKRVLSFLKAEAEKSDDAARAIVEILHRVSATVSVEVRAEAIVAMAAIHRARPGVPSPLSFRAPEQRRTGGGA